MAAEDYWDGRDPWDDDEPRMYPSRSSTSTYRKSTATRTPRSSCSYCKTSGLKWKQMHGEWRLVSQADESPHYCKERHT